MQTFLPHSDFERTAQVLDYRRLGKQRLEAKTIYRINAGHIDGGRWKTHPAVLMWRGYDACLCFYGLVICNEWRSRGYKDQQREFFLAALSSLGFPVGSSLFPMARPPWLGNEAFHASHRAALLHKNLEFYSQWGWAEEPEYNYVWPVRKEVNRGILRLEVQGV